MKSVLKGEKVKEIKVVKRKEEGKSKGIIREEIEGKLVRDGMKTRSVKKE